ncbi:hypothetical protein [Thermococcus nautili]|uniref:Uncharacterized protein n=1 Tax=Thermococcus nautili TaxID=195522 RepID=W8PKE9_9EURY|nr:hypothetical protein [Thermococcus nautili]AHL22559.1 hypothetical protein BD01_0940 [Thermococcus nautili]
MKKHCLFALVTIMLFLFTLPISTATPYWAKPGVYIEYTAKRYNPYIESQVNRGIKPELVTTASLLYFRNGTYYWVDCHNDTLIKFKILTERGEYLTMGVLLNLKNVTIKFEAQNGTQISAFWNSADVISTSKRVLADGKVSVKVKLRSLRIFGEYRIRKKDGMVFGMNGTPYGHTFIWMENVSPNITLVTFPMYNWSATVKSVSPDNQRGLITYYGLFQPPIVTVAVIGPPFKIPGKIEFTTVTPDSLRYDPSTGLVLNIGSVGVALVPDLAAIGIPFASFTDEYYQFKVQNEQENNYLYPTGLVFYDTNAEFQKVQEIPFSKARTIWKYVFWTSIVFLSFVVLKRSFGWPK